jgi:hypothetical protein
MPWATTSRASVTLVVCDGMGGHALGQEASHQLGTIMQMVDGAPPGMPPGVALANAIVQAGRVVIRWAESGRNCRPDRRASPFSFTPRAPISRTSVTAAPTSYGWSDLRLTKTTVQQMIDRARSRPSRASAAEGNKITRALGMG